MPDDPAMGGLDGCDNAAPKALTQRTNQLRLDATATTHSLERLHQRLDSLSSSDGPALEEALRTLLEERSPYRYYETFSPGWTLIAIILTMPVAGDDSLDVSDTSSLQAGCCYALFDGLLRQEIEITEILTKTRIRIQPALTIALSANAKLARTDWTVAPRAAGAMMGSGYFTRTLDLGPSTSQSAIVVGSSPTQAVIGCAFRGVGGLWSDANQGDDRWRGGTDQPAADCGFGSAKRAFRHRRGAFAGFNIQEAMVRYTVAGASKERDFPELIIAK